MSYYFLDTSALVKYYIPEVGSNWINSLISPQAGHTILIAQITPLEIVSSAARRNREGTVLPRTAHAIRLVINRHASRNYMTIGLTPVIIERAQDLLEKHPLRAYDSVQLASALESNVLSAAHGLPVTFISADIRLLAVASAEGLAVDNPNNHP